MALRAMIDGAEMAPGHISAGTGLNHMLDHRKARSGRGYYKYKRTTASSTKPSGIGVISSAGALSGMTDAAGQITSGNSGRIRGRCFFRLITLPNVDMAIFKLKVSTSWEACLVLRPDGVLVWGISNSTTYPGGINEGGTSSVTMQAYGGDWQAWNKIEVDCEIENGAGSTDEITVSATITRPDGGSSTITHSRTGLSIVAGGMSISAMFFDANGARPYGSAGNLSGELDADDMVMVCGTNADAASVTLPTADRVALVGITGQGSSAAWTGSWENVDKTACASVSEPYQEATSDGLDTTFMHQTVAELGLEITAIHAVQLQPLVRSATSLLAEFLIGGVMVNPPGSTNINWDTSTNLSSAPAYCSLQDYTASFDALEYGVRSVSATSTRIYGCPVQILYSGIARAPDLDAAVGYKQKFIRWTGDGSTRREITGVGFASHLVLHFPLTTSTVTGCWHTADRPGNFGRNWSGQAQGDLVQKITSDGFIVGGDLNENTKEYVALCIRDDGNGVGGRVFLSGEFINANGNESEDFATDGEDFQPDQIMLLRRSTSGQVAQWKHVDMASNENGSMNSNAMATTGVTAILANGFTLGSLATLQSATDPIMWIAWRLTPEAAAAGVFAQGAIAASAVDVDVVPGTPPMAPYFVMARMLSNADIRKRFDIPSIFTGVNCQLWENGSIGTSNGIIAIDSAAPDFTVDGAGTVINGSNGAVWLAFGELAEIEPPVEPIEYNFPAGVPQIALIWMEAYLHDGT